MRFIAVFNQLNTTRSVGFNTIIEANDFLFWGYEDRELIPSGIYDILTTQVDVYDHVGQNPGRLDEESIRRYALEYIRCN